MKFFKLLLLIALFSLSIYAIEVNAKVTDTQQLSLSTLNKINKKTNFTFYLPAAIPKDWTVEIKHPENINSNYVDKISLHYFDKTNTKFKFMISEEKAKNDSKELDDYGKAVKINDIIGVYHPLSPTAKYPNVKGGNLSWIQDNETKITMFSDALTKNELLKIASSIQKMIK